MPDAVFDCSRTPAPNNCSVQISGQRDDVVQAAQDHLAATHVGGSDANLETNVTTAVDDPPPKGPYTWIR